MGERQALCDWFRTHPTNSDFQLIVVILCNTVLLWNLCIVYHGRVNAATHKLPRHLSRQGNFQQDSRIRDTREWFLLDNSLASYWIEHKIDENNVGTRKQEKSLYRRLTISLIDTARDQHKNSEIYLFWPEFGLDPWVLIIDLPIPK